MVVSSMLQLRINTLHIAIFIESKRNTHCKVKPNFTCNAPTVFVIRVIKTQNISHLANKELLRAAKINRIKTKEAKAAREKPINPNKFINKGTCYADKRVNNSIKIVTHIKFEKAAAHRPDISTTK
jgi:hypothetical protein